MIELAAPRARRLHARRSLVAGAPTTPGVYLFRDRNETVLYVGKARDLRARLRSYFAGDRQRPAVEAALGALARVEWRELGSELEASLEELRLIRELRPPANAARRGRPQLVPRPARRPLGRRLATPTRFGPIPSKRRAQLAARRARGLRRRRPRRSRCRRSAPGCRASRAICASRTPRGFATASLRSRRSPRGSRSSSGCAREEVCILAPAREPAFWRAFFVARRARRRTDGSSGRGRAARDRGRACAPRRSRSFRLRPRTPQISSSSRAICASRRRSCASWDCAPRRDPRRVAFGACRGNGELRRPPRGGGDAQAEPARRRARPSARPPADGASRRGGARPSRRGVVGRSLLQGDRRRGRSVRRRGQAAVRLLRGARLRRLSRARGGVRLRAAAGLLVLVDAKRGDIGSTSRAYAAAYLEPRDDGAPLADAMTASPYLGQDSVEPFLAACRRTVPASSSSYARPTPAPRTSRTSRSRTAGRCGTTSRELVHEWGEPLVGEAGCRASAPSWGRRPRAVSEARRLLPRRRCCFPVSAHRARPRGRRPSVHGRAGERTRHGSRSVIYAYRDRRAGSDSRRRARAFTTGPATALVTSSRSVIYAYRESEADWRAAAAAEAQRLAVEVWAAAGW